MLPQILIFSISQHFPDEGKPRYRIMMPGFFDGQNQLGNGCRCGSIKTEVFAWSGDAKLMTDMWL